jgi:hypothetical protein
VKFLLKTYIKLSPYLVLVGFFTIGMLSFAFVILMFEVDEGSSHIKVFSESTMLVLSVFTTVGYGNIVPQSMGGQFVTVIACIFGLCVYSMFIFTV